MRNHRSWLAWLGLAAAAAAAAGLTVRWLSSRAAASRPSATPRALPRLSDEEPAGPDSRQLDASPPSSRHWSARPRDPVRRPFSAEDAEALDADELGSAFLARATGHDAPEDLEGDDELAGFQIRDGWR